MFRQILGPLFVVAILPMAAFAQNENAAGDDQIDPVKAPLLDVEAEIQLIRRQLAELSENMTNAVGAIGENQTQIGQLKTDMVTLNGQINQEIQKQQQILDAISKTDSGGDYVPRLNAAMKSKDFRKEMEDAVNESLLKEGDFRIANKTSQYQRILVNRQEYGVSAGETLTLKVPVGTVTTQVPGRDLTNWTLSAPKYEQSIEIVPPSEPLRTTVARPVYAPTTTTYYTPTTSYYAPTTSYYAPTTSYYAPTTSYYAPTTSFMAPSVYYDPYRVYYPSTYYYYWP